MERELSLLERVARGDRLAVPLLLDRYGPLVWSLARRQVGADAAEDVVQEVFIQLWKSAERFDAAVASEATYVTMIARRRIIDHRRKASRRPEVQELVEEAPVAAEEHDEVELADEARVAAEALAELRPDQQRVLRLSIMEGLTHSQIAAVTKLPLGTVKSHARRGLERVRALLAERRQGEGGAP